MDTAAFVCVPANTTMQTTWSDHPNSVNDSFYLIITNVTENATVLCTADGETINASLIVQGKPLKR